MIAAVAALALAAANTAGPPHPIVVSPHPLWSSTRGAVWVTPCAVSDGPLDQCAAIEVRRGADRRRLGEGYMAIAAAHTVLWTRQSGQVGPDVLVLGSGGGSGGCVDLFAVTVLPRRTRTQKLDLCREDTVVVRTRAGRPTFDAVFPFKGRNAANAATAAVPVPVAWNGERFELDLAAVKSRRLGAEDEALRRAAISWSLQDGLTDGDEVEGDALEPALQALAGLMLWGHADQARSLLSELWPRLPVDGPKLSFRPAKGEAEFWTDLCATMVRNPLWSELGLGRLPHADLIAKGAAAARPQPVPRVGAGLRTNLGLGA